MSIYHGVLEKKPDLSDIEKRLKALETLSKANKKGVAANLASIGTHSTELDEKLEYSAMHSFVYTNPTNGAWSSPTWKTYGGPENTYVPLFHVNDTVWVELMLHEFDADTVLSGTETAQYRISFVDWSGNKSHWTFPNQTISNGKIVTGVYIIGLKVQAVSALTTAEKKNRCRAVTVDYKPVSPGKVSGNESRIHFRIYSTTK